MSLSEWRAENERWRAEHAALQRRVAEWEALVQQLTAQLDTAPRAANRPAAPFSTGAPTTNPKPPAHRAQPERVDQVEEAPRPSPGPDCGGPVGEDTVEVPSQVEIPPVQPVTTQFNGQVGPGRRCGQRLQGRPPQPTSDALGAAAVPRGPRALARAAEANHALGVPDGKVSRAAWARAVQRLAPRAQPVDCQWLEVRRESRRAWVEETGWQVGGERAGLGGFTHDVVTR